MDQLLNDNALKFFVLYFVHIVDKKLERLSNKSCIRVILGRMKERKLIK